MLSTTSSPAVPRASPGPSPLSARRASCIVSSSTAAAAPPTASLPSDLAKARRQSMPVVPHMSSSSIHPQPPAKLFPRSVVKLWDSNRSSSLASWDGLRRDPQLWFENGDCLVFLYQRGHSRRGPSFQIPLSCLANAQCQPLLSAIHTPSEASKGAQPSHTELYLPAPNLSTREESFQWHLTTRNFFAWLCGRPVVGQHLGQSLTDLLVRMGEWRAASVDCTEDVLIYADQLHYSAVEDSPDHALAMLDFAETNRIRNVWIDAFAHCVGMNHRLSQSTEFSPISRRTKALITRAFLEMDLHTDRATRALGTFLEEEMSAANLGLGLGARQHLDNFRSLLTTHHVARYGYWPPSSAATSFKDLYLSMYADFSNLYHLLADKDSEEPWRSNNGGICVQQTIDGYNARQKFAPLPYSLPRLPQASFGDGRSKSQLSLRAMINSAKETSSRQHRANKAREQLRAAVNALPADQHNTEVIQRYVAFEDDQASKPDENVSLADARRVRWLLVYSILQMLVSILSAPEEVRNADSAPYFLCVLTDGIPPWEHESRAASSFASPAQTPVSATFSKDIPRENISGASTPSLTIEPDCSPEEFLGPRKESVAETFQTNPSVQLRKSVSRASFLKRASTLRRRSNSQPAPPPESKPTGFIAGRTLAELAYGEPSQEAVCASPTSITFEPQIEAVPEMPRQQPEGQAASKQEHERSPTSDEMMLLLPRRPIETLQYASSESSSVPSLTFSAASREVIESGDPLELEHAMLVNAHAGTRRIDDDGGEHGFQIPKGLVKIIGPGVTKTMHSGSLPRSVTRGYDYFEKMASNSSSGADTPDSLPGMIDKSALIALDGEVDDEAVKSYKAAKMS